MTIFRVQDFEKRPTNFSPLTFGRIHREIYATREAAIEAARRMLLLRANDPIFGVRVLEGGGRETWSSEEGGDPSDAGKN